MYALVTAVEDYPKFLPWCSRAEVLARDEAGMTAKLHLAFAGLKQSFTTRNVHVLDSSVTLSLVDGPFSRLDGAWQFKPLTIPGASQGSACKAEFELAYEFSSKPLEFALSPVFDRVANTFVDAFVKRAAQVYGER